MPITKPPVLPPWADTAAPGTDIVQPTNPEISAGWVQSTTPPSRQRFNWLFNFCANAVRYFSRRGIPDWDAQETYMTGDVVLGDDGLIRRSLQDNNVNRLPSAAGSAWWGPVNAQTPALGDNSTKVATTAYVQGSITGKANTTGNYPGLTVGNATAAASAAFASSAGGVPWAGVTSKPNTVGGYGIVDAITTANIGNQSVNYANSAGRAYPYRWDGAEFRVYWSGQNNQPNWLLGSNDGANWYVWNPSNFSVYQATYAYYGSTQSVGTSNATLATTAFANPSQSLSSPGYVMLPGGLIFQWGFASSGWVAFPISFPNAVFAAFAATSRTTSSSNGANYVANLGLSTMFVLFDQSPNVGWWFAIGR